MATRTSEPTTVAQSAITPQRAGRIAQLEARLLRLPPPRFGVAVQRDISITMPDGVRLFADLFLPRDPGPHPVVLIRTPYGRHSEQPRGGGLLTDFAGKRFAARGFATLAQSVRGRFASEGVFDPRATDVVDGRATLDWIANQSWANGSIAMWGMSYLGFMQWAVAADPPPQLKALAPSFTSPQGAPRYFPDEAFGLLNTLNWVATVHPPEKRDPKALKRAFLALPVRDADQVAVGRTIQFYQDVLSHPDRDDPYWQKRDFSPARETITLPVSVVGGWYDLFLRDTLDDYAVMRAANRAPNLTLGPWTHTSLRGVLETLREGMRWFSIHLRGETQLRRAHPVRIFLMGAKQWRDYDTWPPAATEVSYYPRTRGRLATMAPSGDEPPDSYRYDPANPTPTIGGPVLMPPSGPKDQRKLEARPDVLCYTSAPLATDLDVIGPVRLTLYVRSSLAHTDFLGRLCDVHPNGRSINVCDGLLRIAPGKGEVQSDGSLKIELSLSSTAQRLKRGHRLRLQVASAGHPRWNRNLGTDEAQATATIMCAADQTIYHDAAHPSALIVPVARNA
jgi:putative CocE/NonD family hydrolase